MHGLHFVAITGIADKQHLSEMMGCLGSVLQTCCHRDTLSSLRNVGVVDLEGERIWGSSLHVSANLHLQFTAGLGPLPGSRENSGIWTADRKLLVARPGAGKARESEDRAAISKDGHVGAEPHCDCVELARIEAALPCVRRLRVLERIGTALVLRSVVSIGLPGFEGRLADIEGRGSALARKRPLPSAVGIEVARVVVVDVAEILLHGLIHSVFVRARLVLTRLSD